MDQDNELIETFLKRLEGGEIDGRLNLELARLSYSQLLTVSKILAERNKAPKE